MRFLHNRHGLFDFTLCRLIALRLWLDNRLCRMVDVQFASQKLIALQLQRFDHTLLFAIFNHHMLDAILFRKASIFDFTGLRKIVHNFIQLPIGRYINDNDGASNFLHFARVRVDCQLRIRRQTQFVQLWVACLQQLSSIEQKKNKIRLEFPLRSPYDCTEQWNCTHPSLDVIVHTGRQCCITLRTIAVAGQFQRLKFVGYLARADRTHHQRPVNVHRVGQMLGHRHTATFEIFHIANARVYRQCDITHRRIQTNLIDFANAAEQILHLIFGGLRCNVCNLHDSRGVTTAAAAAVVVVFVRTHRIHCRCHCGHANISRFSIYFFLSSHGTIYRFFPLRRCLPDGGRCFSVIFNGGNVRRTAPL